MCGIAGIIKFDSINEKLCAIVKNLADNLDHRGPDETGFYQDENICFAHKRLAIIDLTKSANQPMVTETKSLVVTFNGEIYNHVELRKELEKSFAFKSHHSDTEVILAAYQKWGIKCLSKLTGMFSIAIYDKEKVEKDLF